MYAVIGLGNPGIRYRNNRHNIGFHVVDYIARRYRIRLKNNSRICAVCGRGIIEKYVVMFLKPTTYMNRSGLCVSALYRYKNISLDNTIVICDDISLPWKKIRIRRQGSSGGHNGIRSIIEELGTSRFPRMKMGIGRPANVDASEYVLGNFTREEKKDIPDYCARAAEAVSTILDCGIETAMNRFN